MVSIPRFGHGLRGAGPPLSAAGSLMRVLFSFLVLASTATTLQGQRVTTPRFAPRHAFASALAADGTGANSESWMAPSAPPVAPKVGHQLLAGVGGWALGFVAGALVGAASTPKDAGLAGGAQIFGVGLVGAAVGSAIGVQVDGKRHGLQSPFLPTLAGSLLGTLPMIVSPVTSPAGATLAYNHFRRERTAP